MKIASSFFILLALFVSIGCTEKPREKVLLFSCDNLSAIGGKSACFAPDDPMHMTIALFAEPMRGDKKRFPDPGTGVLANVIERKTVKFTGDEWVHVVIDKDHGGHQGWIAAAFTKPVQ